MIKDRIVALSKDLFLAVAAADALGVPVEFEDRDERRADPVRGMRGYGTFRQPAGTWSDDFALVACTVESMIAAGPSKLDLQDLGNRFCNWYRYGYWAVNQVFDIGIATQMALERIEMGCDPYEAGGVKEFDNGNGALMRILPLLLHPLYQQADSMQRQELVQELSSVTHRHSRSALACYLYLQFADQLLHGRSKQEAYAYLCEHGTEDLTQDLRREVPHFTQVLSGQLQQLEEDAIDSSGYVLHTLTAALWCVLNHNSYADTVLAAVNLGFDTDTTAAVAGPLALLAEQQRSGIPVEWRHKLAKRAEIEDLADRFITRMDWCR
ncbi:ADP-ribosylglycohydrolase family protein [Hymenobacter sp. ZK17L-C2]|uniref:ADP-ribosylglycohydrolase family protein n=2 Tax=Hymenobacteraceae TaxID=1853232 RepID=A0ABU3TCJ4_9BACT|nr:ADP-ribosylglycohydrolase family protein [Hymenobacter endophyticus]